MGGGGYAFGRLPARDRQGESICSRPCSGTVICTCYTITEPSGNGKLTSRHSPPSDLIDEFHPLTDR